MSYINGLIFIVKSQLVVCDSTLNIEELWIDPRSYYLTRIIEKCPFSIESNAMGQNITTVDINMIATFEDLGGSQGGGITLGSAGPVNFQTDDEVDGIDENFWYGKPLFENLRGFDDSITGDSNDINARFNSNPDVNWYYGTDANPPANQIDFVSVVLHEIGHGIAFVGSASVDGNNIDGFTGSAFLDDRPIIFNDFIETGDGTALLTIEEDSAAMALTLMILRVRLIEDPETRRDDPEGILIKSVLKRSLTV